MSHFSLPMILASSVVAHARQLLGVPWRHRGRDPQNGVDCLGLLLLALFGAGWTPKHPGAASRLDYDRTSSTEELHEVLSGEGTAIDLSDKSDLLTRLQRGDVLEFRFPDHAYPQHVALVTDVDAERVLMIHARATNSKSTSRVVEHGLADGWLESLAAAYRIDGVTLDG